MNADHSPTPWKQTTYRMIVDANNEIVLVDEDSGGMPEERANMALIVRAVNAHVALIAACEAAAAVIEDDIRLDCREWGCSADQTAEYVEGSPILCQLREALALAKEAK